MHICMTPSSVTTTPSLDTSGCKSRRENCRDRNVAVLCIFCWNYWQCFEKKGFHQDATHLSSLIKKVFRCPGRCWCFDDSVECRGPCFQSWAKGIFDQGVLNGALMRTWSPVMINMCRLLPIIKVCLLHACFQRDNFRRYTRNECNINRLNHNLTLGLLAVLNIKSNLLQIFSGSPLTLNIQIGNASEEEIWLIRRNVEWSCIWKLVVLYLCLLGSVGIKQSLVLPATTQWTCTETCTHVTIRHAVKTRLILLHSIGVKLRLARCIWAQL